MPQEVFSKSVHWLIIPIIGSSPGIPNNTTSAAVITATASAAQDTYVSYKNQDNKDIEDDKDYERSVKDDRATNYNRTAGVPKVSLSGSLTNVKGILMLRQGSLTESATCLMAHGLTTITPRLLHM